MRKADKNARRHKVTCMECGRTVVITVPKCGYRCTCDGGTGEWHWFGKLNVASTVTSKYLYEWDVKKGVDDVAFKRIKNPRYNPKAKRKYVEMWECHDCFFKRRQTGGEAFGRRLMRDIPVEPKRVVKPPPKKCKLCPLSHICLVEGASWGSDFCYHIRGSWCRCKECTGPYYIVSHDDAKEMRNQMRYLMARVKELENELKEYENWGELAGLLLQADKPRKGKNYM